MKLLTETRKRYMLWRWLLVCAYAVPLWVVIATPLFLFIKVADALHSCCGHFFRFASFLMEGLLKGPIDWAKRPIKEGAGGE